MSAAAEKYLPMKLGPTRMNTSDEDLLSNIEINIRRQLPQINVLPSRPKRVILVAGGPSLDSEFNNLRHLAWKGHRIFAMNGTAKWLTDRNILPQYQVILDAQPENLVFVEEPIPDCTYLLASHVHPSVFEACKDRNVWIFHTCPLEAARQLFNAYYFDQKSKSHRPGATRWQWINAGTTVGLGTIGLARCLGFPFLELFGYDSCCQPDARKYKHHAYDQPWNDVDHVFSVMCKDREFFCTQWQMRQADNFYKLLEAFSKHFSINIYGDGLLAHIIATRARPWVRSDSDAS